MPSWDYMGLDITEAEDLSDIDVTPTDELNNPGGEGWEPTATTKAVSRTTQRRQRR